MAAVERASGHRTEQGSGTGRSAGASVPAGHRGRLRPTVSIRRLTAHDRDGAVWRDRDCNFRGDITAAGGLPAVMGNVVAVSALAPNAALLRFRRRPKPEAADPAMSGL